MNKTAEQIREWYKEWCKQTKRSGGILVGGSMIELLTAYDAYTQSETEQLKCRVAELEKENEQLREIERATKIPFSK